MLITLVNDFKVLVKNSSVSWRLVILGFFFQAEDGIRDIGVTGVQTCALPICQRIIACVDDA